MLVWRATAGVVPDPYYDMNLPMFTNMPMAQDSLYICGWLYRTEFTAPAASHQG
jgi:hypothetical protein